VIGGEHFRVPQWQDPCENKKACKHVRVSASPPPNFIFCRPQGNLLYTPFMPTELTIMHAIQDILQMPWLNLFMVWSARWFIFLIPLLGIIGRAQQRLSRHALKELVWTTLLAACLAFGLEWLLGRARPFVTDPTLQVLVPRPHTMSFPSAHASIAYAMAFAIFDGIAARCHCLDTPIWWQ
jgi:membrane-associated phospholipid phosphatase